MEKLAKLMVSLFYIFTLDIQDNTLIVISV